MALQSARRQALALTALALCAVAFAPGAAAATQACGGEAPAVTSCSTSFTAPADTYFSIATCDNGNVCTATFVGRLDLYADADGFSFHMRCVAAWVYGCQVVSQSGTLAEGATVELRGEANGWDVPAACFYTSLVVPGCPEGVPQVMPPVGPWHVQGGDECWRSSCFGPY